MRLGDCLGALRSRLFCLSHIYEFLAAEDPVLIGVEAIKSLWRLVRVGLRADSADDGHVSQQLLQYPHGHTANHVRMLARSGKEK